MSKSHRFERSEAHIKRSKPKKQPFDRILIVCEGEKTEVNYFDAIRRELRIPKAEVEALHSVLGTEPLQIVEYAELHFEKSRAFDCVFVVFDRDDHKTYNNALSKAAALNFKLKSDEGRGVLFRAITSVPNFEFWLLLHFKEVLAFMHRTAVYAELRKPSNYPNYAKNSLTVYSDTKGRIPLATQRASHLRTLYNSHSGTDPYTEVDILTGKMLEFGNRLK